MSVSVTVFGVSVSIPDGALTIVGLKSCEFSAVVLGTSLTITGIRVDSNSSPDFMSLSLVARGVVDGNLGGVGILFVNGKFVDTGRSSVNDMLCSVVDMPLPLSALPD